MAKACSVMSTEPCDDEIVLTADTSPENPSKTEHDAGDQDLSLTEVLHLAQSSVATLKTFLDHLDNTVGDDFHQIMEKISQTRQDVAHLNIKSADNCPIADAEKELQLVVKATEDATHRIMQAAETIMTADPGDAANYHLLVQDNIMELFEACSFQDITGQRINRVVETLEFVDLRVHKIARLLGLDKEFGQREFDEEAIEQRRQRKDDLILHGPQEKDEAICQSEIDNLF